MWCVEASDTFEEAVLLAANLAGDAGTTAGLTGELAGALYGASSIPARWLEQLAWAGYINDCIKALLGQSLRHRLTESRRKFEERRATAKFSDVGYSEVIGYERYGLDR